MRTNLLAKVAAIMRPDYPLLVTRGLVACPSRNRDVEVDRCFACASFQDTTGDDDGNTWLRCRAT
jgi:hypothetical protein